MLGIMGSESHSMGGNQFLLVFWKTVLHSVWSIIYVLIFARSENRG